MAKRALILAFALALSCGASAQTATGLQEELIFTNTTPLSENGELIRRLLTAQVYAEAVSSGANLHGQSLDIGKERFVVYVPAVPPPSAGYALMVFVPPWNTAKLPYGWAEVFDAHAMIFVSAAQSGNDQNVYNRRIPLALLAEANIAARYHLDPARIYVGGFSGGSRVAMRVALAYPDVFDGAFLNAGSDAIGTDAIPLPPPDLFRRFQENTRLYYATGAQDVGSLGLDAGSRKSMRDHCVFNIVEQRVVRTTHEVASARVLSSALDYLDTPPANDAAQLTTCRAAQH
ncbi:MAG: hypothetical protein JSR81_08030 [Proteobacteria bacterium]|nr:hypothetical protein [Pseudomonadota bacterium]